MGGSYLGFTQWALLAGSPPELTTAVVTMGPHDFSIGGWGTGSFALADFLTWAYQMAWHEHGGIARQFVRTALTPRTLRPVFAKLPVAGAADAAMAGRSPFYNDWVENPDPSSEYWRERAVPVSARQPVLLIGGWQDVFIGQTVQQFHTLRGLGADVALFVGPWTHGEGGGIAIRETLDWLAGRRRPQRVRIFVTGDGGWRDMPDWPPPSVDRLLYPNRGATLADEPPTEATELRFRYDQTDPTPTIGGRLLAPSLAGYRDDSALATRADVLAFTGPALAADVEVIGVPRVELAHSADTPSADVFVRISEVDRNGRSRTSPTGTCASDPSRRRRCGSTSTRSRTGSGRAIGSGC